MKTLVIVLVALAIGAIGAALLAQQHYSVEREDLEQRIARDEGELEKLKDALARTDALSTELEQDRDLLRERIAELTRAPQIDVPPPLPLEALAAELFDEEPVPTEEEPAAPTEEEPRRRGRGRDREPTEEGRAEWEERRETFRQEIRQRVDDFFDSEYAAAPTTEAQERVAQVKEDLDYMMQLRQEMHNAETDEERDEIRQEMMHTGMELRDLVAAQQDFMLRNVAQDFGVKSQEQQDAFIATIRGVQSSPYFQPERYMGGMGRGGGGGFGGGPPRGGPPAGD